LKVKSEFKISNSDKELPSPVRLEKQIECKAATPSGGKSCTHKTFYGCPTCGVTPRQGPCLPNRPLCLECYRGHVCKLNAPAQPPAQSPTVKGVCSHCGRTGYRHKASCLRNAGAQSNQILQHFFPTAKEPTANPSAVEKYVKKQSQVLEVSQTPPVSKKSSSVPLRQRSGKNSSQPSMKQFFKGEAEK